MRRRTFPHAPRLEPDLRLSPHPAQHLGSFLGVIQTIKHLSHFRSRLHARARVRRNITQPMFGLISLRIRVILPHAPELPRLGAFAISPHPGVHGFPVRRLLCPIRLSPGASSFRETFPPHYFPTALPIPRGVSRVRHGRLKQNAVGGVFLSLPHPLFAAPQSLDLG